MLENITNDALLKRSLYTEHFHVMIPALPYFSHICYPCIMLHFQCFLLLVFDIILHIIVENVAHMLICIVYSCVIVELSPW